MEDLYIDKRYNRYSLFVVLHLIHNYKQERFAADCIAVKFINENPDSVNFDNVESDASPDITGNAFSMPATEAHYQDFLASLQQKNAMFNHFVPVTIGDKLIVTFF